MSASACRVVAPLDGLPPLKYLRGYPPDLLTQARVLIAQGELSASLRRRYPDAHDVRTDPALYEYVDALKSRYMRNVQAVAKVAYDPRLHVIQNALGTQTTVSRVQGGRLKAKREIRIASLFKAAPAPFLKMIVVHELAHLKESAHDKSFYALCRHMEPTYFQLEFDVRLWLTAQELEPAAGS